MHKEGAKAGPQCTEAQSLAGLLRFWLRMLVEFPSFVLPVSLRPFGGRNVVEFYLFVAALIFILDFLFPRYYDLWSLLTPVERAQFLVFTAPQFEHSEDLHRLYVSLGTIVPSSEQLPSQRFLAPKDVYLLEIAKIRWMFFNTMLIMNLEARQSDIFREANRGDLLPNIKLKVEALADRPLWLVRSLHLQPLLAILLHLTFLLCIVAVIARVDPDLKKTTTPMELFPLLARCQIWAFGILAPVRYVAPYYTWGRIVNVLTWLSRIEDNMWAIVLPLSMVVLSRYLPGKLRMALYSALIVFFPFLFMRDATQWVTKGIFELLVAFLAVLPHTGR